MLKLRDNKIFIYEANSKNGVTKGEIIAKDISMAKTLLRKQGTDVISIKPKGKNKTATGKVSPEDIAIFSRQMSTMLGSGISLVEALNVVIDGAEKVSYRQVIKGLREEVESGKSFSTALKKYPLKIGRAHV